MWCSHCSCKVITSVWNKSGRTSITTTPSPPGTPRFRVWCSQSSRRRWAITTWPCATSTTPCSSTWLTCTTTPPSSWTGLTFQITLRGTRVRVNLSREEICFEVVEGDTADLYVRGKRVVVTAGTPSRVALVDHGPRFDHVPSLQTGDRRPDGTLITASVPQATPVRG